MVGALAVVLNLVAPPPALLEYDVSSGRGGRELRVAARLRNAGPRLRLDDDLGRFVRDLEEQGPAGWRPLAMAGDLAEAPACGAGDCRLRYRVLLGEAALALRDFHRAVEVEGVVVSPPSSWLLWPLHARRGRWRLRVTAAPGERFVTGLFPHGASGHESDLADLPQAPYSALGAMDVETLTLDRASVQIAYVGHPAAEREAVRQWARRGVEAATAVYGHFPVPHALVIVLPGQRRPVGFGTTLGNGGASILIWVARGARAEDLRRDWVLTHELLHLGLPNLGRDARWLEEGLSTYLEPLARARQGLLTDAEVWQEFVKGLPRGVVGTARQDHRDVWGPMYWGGALFWLEADMAIRQRTSNRRRLEDALRGIQAGGGSIAVSWDVPRALRVGDEATGLSVLADLHDRRREPPFAADLDALWKSLGVVPGGGAVTFDDEAPLAWLRRALTERAPVRAARPVRTRDQARRGMTESSRPAWRPAIPPP
jgi:hypothetical protein